MQKTKEPTTPYLFRDGRGRQLTPNQVVAEIIGYMKKGADRTYKVTLGTDSEQAADKRADFVTAIVVHRVGNGARYFWHRALVEKRFHTLRDRMYQEVLLSLEVARHFLETTSLFSLPKFDFEIHIDIGENGATKTMLQELTGMIRANNFAFQTKPHSYAASKVADRHSKAFAIA